MYLESGLLCFALSECASAGSVGAEIISKLAIKLKIYTCARFLSSTIDLVVYYRTGGIIDSKNINYIPSRRSTSFRYCNVHTFGWRWDETYFLRKTRLFMERTICLSFPVGHFWNVAETWKQPTPIIPSSEFSEANLSTYQRETLYVLLMLWSKRICPLIPVFNSDQLTCFVALHIIAVLFYFLHFYFYYNFSV